MLVRAQARSLVAKGVRSLVVETGTIQERVAKALPEAGWLANDAGGVRVADWTGTADRQ